MGTLRDMQERKANLVAQVREIMEGKTALSSEDRSRVDGLMVEIEGLAKDCERSERLAGMESDLVRSASGHRPEIGMSQGEIRRYSLLRAINAAASGDWSQAGLEREASRAVSQLYNKSPEGFFIPFDWMAADGRALDKTNTAAQLVATDKLNDSFIELLRNKLVVRQAGATVLSGLVGDVSIPKATGGATAYWVAESSAITASNQTIDQASMTPKTVGAFTDISRKLLKQSSLDVEMFVRNDLAMTVATSVDLKALHGTGLSNTPKGVASTSGIGSVAGGDNGLAPAWSHIVGLETEVSQDNADVGAMAYITNSKVRGKLRQTFTNATYGDRPIWEPGDTMNGYPALVSNQVSSALTKGTSSGVCSAIFFGNWRDLILGLWGTLDILVDPYTGSSAGTVRIVALQDVDVTVRHAESFAAMLDALTS